MRVLKLEPFADFIWLSALGGLMRGGGDIYVDLSLFVYVQIQTSQTN